MVEHGGSQCGYCTPGFVVSLFWSTTGPAATASIPESISGNLCRCTGYRPIARRRATLPAPRGRRSASGGARRAGAAADARRQRARRERFVRPTSLDELFRCLGEAPAATLIAGGTDLMVGVTQKGDRQPLLISLEARARAARLRGDAATRSCSAPA